MEPQVQFSRFPNLGRDREGSNWPQLETGKVKKAMVKIRAPTIPLWTCNTPGCWDHSQLIHTAGSRGSSLLIAALRSP